MCRIVFAAMFAITLGSVRAEEQKNPANAGFPARMITRADLLKEFDKDGDGKLSEQERAAMMEKRKALGEQARKAREKEFDKDGDGKLNDQEKAAMMAEMQKKHPNGPQLQEMIKRFDTDGDGKLNEQERAAMMEKRHAIGEQIRKAREKEFDKDGDGKLNDQEKAAMMAEMQKNPPNGPHLQEILKRFDKDGDGKLNEQERKAMAEAHTKHLQVKDGETVNANPAAAPAAAPAN